MANHWTVEKIQAEMDIDCKLDKRTIDSDIQKLPAIHSKYAKMVYETMAELRELYVQKDVLIHSLTAYYTGTAEVHVYKERKPFPIKVLKSEVDRYIQVDPLYVPLRLQIGEAESRLELIRDALKLTRDKGFAQKNLLDYIKWESGAGGL